MYAHPKRYFVPHDQFIKKQILEIFLNLSRHFLTHAAIQVQFLQNASTVNEADVVSVRLSIQLLLTPTSATLQSNIIVTVSVLSGSATGTVHGHDSNSKPKSG